MATETPNNLIKYCNAKSAEQILNSQCLRWSSPEVFGDPFELSSKTNIGFDKESLLKSIVKLASGMLFSSDDPKGDSPIVNAIKRWRDEERFTSPEEAHDVLRELLSKMVAYRSDQLGESLSKWQLFVRNIRVCCLCSKSDNINAWEKYADWHQGVAIRFSTADGSTIANPQAVTYQSDPAKITTEREQLACILHNKKDTVTSRFKEQYLNKGPHHKLEREWRSIQSSKKNIPTTNNNPEEWFDDIPFAKDEILAVYFGLNTTDEVKKRITAAIKAKYKGTRLFQAIPAKTGYAIEIEKLTAS